MIDDSIFPRRSCVHFVIAPSVFLHIREWMRDASLRDELSISFTHSLASSTELPDVDSANSDAGTYDTAAPFIGPEAPSPADIALEKTTTLESNLGKPYISESLRTLSGPGPCFPPGGPEAKPPGGPQHGPWETFLLEAARHASAPATSN